MSRILKDLMTPSQPQQDSAFSSEPRFNPLAGSSERPPARPWRAALLILAYSAVISVIAWQGWQLAERAFAPSPGADSAERGDRPVMVLEDADTAEPETDEPTTPDEPMAGAAQPEPDRQLAPITLPRGTADLPRPPLVEPQPPEPDNQPEGTARGGAGETALSGSEETALSGSAETSLSADESAPSTPQATTPETTETATEDDPEPAVQTTQPDIASVADTAYSGEGAQFSNTRRNRALNQAQALYQSGREDEALMQLAQWLREDDHTDVRQYYARLLLRADRAEEARYIVRPNYNREELELRAYADFQVNAFRDSLRHYSALLDRADTIQTEWYLWLAICHDNLNETSQAVAFYQTFLDQNGNQPESLVRHARERLTALSG